MSSPIFDIEIRAFDRGTGKRLALNPKLVLSGVTWSYVELGGAEMATVPIKVPFEDVPVANGDFIEIWALNTGETVPRWRGICNVGERGLALAEKHVITAYGRMEDMAHVVVDKVICHPNSMDGSSVNTGADLQTYARDILADYIARITQSTAYKPLILGDFQTTGINIQTLDATLTTARAAMDAIAAQGGANIVWGWDIDPLTGADRLYIRPRLTTSVGNQFYIGVGVSEITAPMEYQALTNAAWLKGGPALYPNLLTNPSFEVPVVPTGQAGNLLSDGSFEASGASSGFTEGWYGINGATLADHDPSNNWNFTAHTGQWCVTLGYLTDGGSEVYQECAATHGTAYIASLYSAREDDAYANIGALIVEGRNSSGTVIETYTLPFAPPSVDWTGGQDSTVLGGTSIQMPVTFVSSSITVARIRVKVTATGSATQNLLIDDVLFAPVGGVGTLGWGTHVENVGSSSNEVLSVDWVNPSSPWDGWYCTRINTVADSSNKVYIAPLPEPGTSGGAEFASGGYQFHPTPGMELRIGVRVRMSPGIAAADGSVGLEYRSHAGDGHENQFVEGSLVSIPNDGNWHYLSLDVDVNGDTAIAITQLSFNTSDWYDVDGWSARDQAADEGGKDGGGEAIDPATAGYLRGTDFEAVLDVANANVIAATPALSALAQASIDTYGRREAVVSNKNLVVLDGQCYSWVATWLNQFAVPLGRTRVSLADEQDQQPNPGGEPGSRIAALIRVSGTANDIPDQFATKTTYTWTGRLGVSIELTTQRPTLDKMLLSAALASASQGSSSTGSALAASSSGTPSGGGAMPGLVTQTDVFAVTGLGPYDLTQTPDGILALVFTDLGFEGAGISFASLTGSPGYTIDAAAKTIALNSGYAWSAVKQLIVVYSYVAAADG